MGGLPGVLPPGTPGIGERLREKAKHAYTIGGHGGATVIAIIAVVVVRMDWPARPTLRIARGR